MCRVFLGNNIFPMKTLPVLTIVAALAAFLVSVPFGFEVTVSAVFAVGLLGILLADYAQTLRPARLQLTPVNFSTQRSERLRLAA